ncbi:pp-loop family protein [Colletotrichum karsti]|uniref:tRNA(Ile)-lysidine synthetase n=1 Tax=Colletotrichum karsti TaxID=1095194 RepID=A0A9P6LMJ1_9PEZI|nr:pp-loop family protein [Colletotrichum karsti]KAF9878475.1 pp-loop family protein [Colletotrichum karsti]
MPPPPPPIHPSQILHPVPRPISFLEFSAALRACAPPRFPHARVSQRRRVLLAVSGGLDSMALAFLFNQHRAVTPTAPVVDNCLGRISAMIVDHRLRPGSGEEAAAVARELRTYKHVSPVVEALDWKRDVGVEGDPADAPNLESLARRARYRRIGAFCRSLHIESVFLAHHEDDQHETVLMRLLAGHGSRGLRGIMPRADIPECHDMHGVYESGHVDDLTLPVPPISFRPPRREWRWVRRELSDELDWDLYSAEARAGSQEAPYTDPDEEDVVFSSARARAKAAAAAAAVRNVPRIETEDAGVMLYRPLLGFSKDRLRATCEHNKVRWFEDPTNEDRTLTMRNAVRHMVRNHELPAALSKENILRLSARCDERVRAQEREAERWIRRGVVADFEPNAGTLVVELPTMAVPLSKRRTTTTKRRRELRLAHRRTIAAIVVRKLLSFVSPEKHYAQLSSLQSVVARLFPLLAEEPEDASTRKAFNQASVLFLPVPTHPRKWYLTREPYPSNIPTPETSFITASGGAHRRFPQFPPGPRPGSTWRDGETDALVSLPPLSPDLTHSEWLRHLATQPLPAPDANSKNWRSWRRFELWDGRFWIRVKGRVRACFRVAPFGAQHAKAFREGLADEGARSKLEVVLKRFAPGKVRYTLPALYAVNRDEETGCEILRMLALPTLGVQLPGVERWVKYEVRYRKVDWELLGRDEDEE